MKLSDLLEICSSQKNALDAQDPGLERHLLQHLPDIKTHALVISGIRRCGKSTLLRQFVKKLDREYLYLNFDDLRIADFSKADYRLLDKVIEDSRASILFFDEIQSAGHWELYVRQKLEEAFQLVITNPHDERQCIQVCRELTSENQDREIKGLMDAMDFFNQQNGIILTYNTEDIILSAGKKIDVIPAWKWNTDQS